MNDVCITDISGYVEFKAKTLCKELSENFDIHKCCDLHKTLGDLLKIQKPIRDLTENDLITGDAIPLTTIKKCKAPPKKNARKQYLKRGEKQAIIDLILDRFFEESKSGKTEFVFYGKDFGTSGEYLQRNIFNSLNTNPIKQKRFPDLKIRYMAIPGGVSCHIGRKK